MPRGSVVGERSPQGFSEATMIGRYRLGKKALATSIHAAEEMLAGVRTQPN